MTSDQLQELLTEALHAFPLPAQAPGSRPARIDSRPMFGTQAYLLGGKVFAAVGAMGLLLKLPPEQRQALLSAGTAGPFSLQPGATFGEWVAVPSDGWDTAGPAALLALVRASFDYVTSAPPKVRPPREQRHFRKRMY